MNYQVFVPEVLHKTVEDCYVLVYDEAGKLVRMHHAVEPFDSDPRVANGNFSFKLAPGEYTTYCYTNVGELSLSEIDLLETAYLGTKRVEDVRDKNKFDDYTDDAYAQPPALSYRKLAFAIHMADATRLDTVEMERYTGRITSRFKNFPDDISRVAYAQLITRGVGTRQGLAQDTIASCFSEDDYLFIDEMPVQHVADQTLEIDYQAFPSRQDQLIIQHVKFFDAQGNVISTIPVEMRDLQTNQPLRLLHGQRIILEVESYTVVRVDIVRWDEDISNSDRDI
jgi:hypothetical protein